MINRHPLNLKATIQHRLHSLLYIPENCHDFDELFYLQSTTLSSQWREITYVATVTEKLLKSHIYICTELTY
jgi:hypothetical protein